MEFLISQRELIAGLAFPNDRDFVAVAFIDVLIETVVAGVGLPADEPFRIRLFPLERLVERLKPVEFFFRKLFPKRRWVRLGLIPEFFVSLDRTDF